MDAYVKPKVFLDSSALISAVMSKNDDSDMRRLLKLGETNIIDLKVSHEVLNDTEFIIRKNGSASLPLLAVIFDASNLSTTLDPSEETIEYCIDLTGYLPDARVLARAVESDCNLFVTFDFEHFLQNPLIGPPRTKLKVVNAYDALDWISEYVGNQVT
jgi:predicted nucleic acid-binding protein